MGLQFGWVAVAGVPDEVLGRGYRTFLHSIHGRVPFGLRGQHVCGAGGVQKRAHAIVTN